jgi:prepilin-type N-terminal cleavage/methylation domain-containing protein
MKETRKCAQKGFTLVEMLVVIGIIAILAAASMLGYSKVIKTAQKTKNRELVSNAATALTQILTQNNGSWPELLLKNSSGGKGRLDKETCQVFITFSMMGLSYKKDKRSDGTYELIGKDRCGVVDADAEKVLKRSTSASEGTKVPTGGTVQDHILYFAIDEDGDGFTEAQVEGGGNLTIRATAVVWAAGPDGKVDYGTMAHNDDVYSWTPGQVKK